MPDSVQNNRRQDFRVDDVIPIRDEPLTTEEFEVRKNKVGIRSRQNRLLQQMVGHDIFGMQAPEGLTPDLAAALESLDAKLNYLIGVNMLNDANRCNLEERPVNLSVTGASFVTRETYKTGDALQLTLMLPSFPPIVLELLGEIVWSSKTDQGKTHVGVRFLFRCDDEEDSLARYVFRRHRENIRLEARRAQQVGGNA